MNALTISKKNLALLTAFWFPFAVRAQDTTDLGRMVVEGAYSPDNGYISQEDTPKARSSVTRASIEQKSSSNNAFQLVNLLPGINSFSYDSTGLFGGGLRMRGFSSDQVGVTIDGTPINDSGNFAVYPQELTDTENLEEISVTQGSTATDAPYVGASRGNINMVTSAPVNQLRLLTQQTFGSNNARRTFFRGDTGYLGDNRFKAFGFYSMSEADKWKGAGKADREHVDFKGVFNISPSSSISADLLWNKIFNNNLRTLTLRQIDTLGRKADFGIVAPQRLAGVNGIEQNEATTPQYNNILNNPDSAGYGYYGFNVNPFENYIATMKGNFQLAPVLRLDVEPYYWYGHGTGGNQLGTLKEINSAEKVGGGIRDINGDGDTIDTVMIYTSSMTEAHRPGITTRLSTQLANHTLMAGYWYEWAHHHQTKPGVHFDNSGHSVDPWLQTPSNFLLRQDGTIYQDRDWLVINKEQSVFLQDSISLMNNKFKLQLGVRNSGITRNFTNTANDGAGGGATYNIQKSYNKTLPCLGALYQLNNEQQVFFNVAENFKVPVYSIFSGLVKGGTFNDGVLTGYTLKPVNVIPETSTNYDLGYRYAGKDITFSGSLFYVDFKDRLGTAYDPANQISTNYNVGDSITKGFELESAWRFQPQWSIYGSLTHTLSRICRMTHLAQRTDLTAKQHNYLTKINNSAQSLLRIINNILDFSKIEAGKLELMTFSLDDVLSTLSDIVGLKAEEKGIGLVFSIAPETPRQLLGDSLRLSQILINLVNNAIKFTDRGEVTVAVMLEEQRDETALLKYSVTDTGIGMTAAQISDLFQPFSQADTSITRHYGDTGLGLAISKQLAETMGGRIWVESEPGKGSTFAFTTCFYVAETFLPSEKEAEPNKPIDESIFIDTINELLAPVPSLSIHLEQNRERMNFAAHLAGQRILLIEDNAINRELTTELLADLGITVEIAENGLAGITRATSEAFDLALRA